jgi:predicted flap endonuclease-1-like 5' DNA nuclease
MASSERLLPVQAPNRHFDGVRAGADFEGGEGKASPQQARELRQRGYTVPALGGDGETGAGAELDEAEGARERLMQVEGIGDGYARQLMRAGIETPGALAAAVPADLAERSGLGAERIKHLQEAAAALLASRQ